MSTKRRILVAAALGAAALAPGSAQAAPQAATQSFALRQTQTLGNRPTVPPAYGWPVKPFERQHPVRAFLDDPRIGHEGGKAFHFGIDVAAPDGTPVYAVEGGILYLSHGSLSVVSGPHHEFGYWHVRAARNLREHQIVHKHQLLGTIAPGWGHVHFAERIRDEYVNPLRPGGLGPYTDPVAPTVVDVTVARHGPAFQLIAHAYDTTWPLVPGRWSHEPVTPALLRWRLGSSGPWHVAADFRRHMLDRSLFASVYAPETRQNHQSNPGSYAFLLSHDWEPADGTYTVEVEASDTRGNRAVGSARITVLHGDVSR
jgi:murein DD-endopeptidase MepM/ murein hydrolase activator NlpD